MTRLLRVKKSHSKNEWILYNPQNFENRHTHCKYKRVALTIKHNIEHQIMPKSKNLETIYSHIRVCPKGTYKKSLELLYISLGGFLN